MSIELCYDHFMHFQFYNFYLNIISQSLTALLCSILLVLTALVYFQIYDPEVDQSCGGEKRCGLGRFAHEPRDPAWRPFPSASHQGTSAREYICGP